MAPRTRRRRGRRLRRRTTFVDPEQPLRNGARPVRSTVDRESGQQITRRCREQRALLGASRCGAVMREDDTGVARFRPQPRLPGGRPRVRGGAGDGEAELDSGAPDGIELVSLAAAARPRAGRLRGGLRGRRGDVPRPEGDDFEGQTLRPLARAVPRGPWAVPDALIAALAGDEVVGYTGLRRRGASSPVAENMLTAVRRDWRRRGIATALKREQVARAVPPASSRSTRRTTRRTRACGVNARLGYRPAPTQIVVSGPLAT